MLSIRIKAKSSEKYRISKIEGRSGKTELAPWLGELKGWSAKYSNNVMYRFYVKNGRLYIELGSTWVAQKRISGYSDKRIMDAAVQYISNKLKNLRLALLDNAEEMIPNKDVWIKAFLEARTMKEVAVVHRQLRKTRMKIAKSRGEQAGILGVCYVYYKEEYDED